MSGLPNEKELTQMVAITSKLTFRVEWRHGGFEVFESASFETATKYAIAAAKRSYREIKSLSEIKWPPETA